MERTIEIVPAQGDKNVQPWELTVDFAKEICRITDDTENVHCEFSVKEIPERLQMPEFAGANRWPVFRFDDRAVEFKVDKDCMAFLNSLNVAALAMGGKRNLRTAALIKVGLIILGILLMVVVTPLCAYVFWNIAENYKDHWFGITAGAFCMGLILVVNSIRGLGAVRRAARLVDETRGGSATDTAAAP